MVEVQPMKLTENVFAYLVSKKDNIGHIGKTLSPSQETINRQNVERKMTTDTRRTEQTWNEPEQDESPLDRMEKSPNITEILPFAHSKPKKANKWQNSH